MEVAAVAARRAARAGVAAPRSARRGTGRTAAESARSRIGLRAQGEALQNAVVGASGCKLAGVEAELRHADGRRAQMALRSQPGVQPGRRPTRREAAERDVWAEGSRVRLEAATGEGVGHTLLQVRPDAASLRTPAQSTPVQQPVPCSASVTGRRVQFCQRSADVSGRRAVADEVEGEVQLVWLPGGAARVAPWAGRPGVAAASAAAPARRRDGGVLMIALVRSGCNSCKNQRHSRHSPTLPEHIEEVTFVVGNAG